MLNRARRRPLTGESAGRKHKPDYWLPMIATGLLAVGLVVVYSISPGVGRQKGVNDVYFVSKQLFAIGLGLSAFVTMSKIPYLQWRKFVQPLVIASVVASLAVFVLGEEVNGAHRWIQFGGMSFQSAELVKFALLIWLADLLATRKQNNELADEQKTLKPIMYAVVAIGVVIAGLQSDLGSTAVMVGMIGAMIFLSGVPLKRLLTIGLIVVAGVVLLISITPYRRARLATFFNPAADCQTTGYQSCQALIAVGSGGLFGLGLGHSVQAYGYLPEAANDSIFAILAEKFGFLGMSMVLGAYAVFFTRISKIVERAPDDFSRFVVVGVLAWFSVQAFINIGAMLAIIPLKGITLPFISYGGTSLLFVTGALGLVFQISKFTRYTSSNTGDNRNEDSSNRRGVGGSYYTSARRRT